MKWFLLYSFVLSFVYFFVGNFAENVTYDGRSLIIDGQHKILFSGSVHYPRSTTQMWPDLISKAKEGGIDVIQTYVFWNLHEPKQGQYDFSGNKDIVKFIKEVKAQGLYVCLRIGPFIESEWSYGGFPFWLHDIPGISYRTDNEPFKEQMQKFTKKIVDLMKSEGLYASQGGPIILSQIENEYGSIEGAFHEKGKSYVRWAAQMAVGLQTGVPWSMCKQDDAPDPVINSCNGMRCGETFAGPNSPNKPALWTENWTSFYQVYGEEPFMRSAEDIAYHVALFIAKKGSYVNYYMYHGGTNFGRTASSYTITGYYDQAPLDEYGLIRQPKYGHLKDLHTAIKLCSKILVSEEQTILPLGPSQEAYVFGDYKSGKCAAFLVNKDSRDVKVNFSGDSYQLTRKSIIILPDCKNPAFNSAKVNTQYGTRSMVPSEKFDSATRWEKYREVIPSYDDTTALRSKLLLEQTSTTKDESDYLWYTFRLRHNSPEASATLSVQSLAHVLSVFVNGQFVGSKHGAHNSGGFTLDSHITLKNGLNYISLLSGMVGLPDAGSYLEKKVHGLRSVSVQDQDLSTYSWGYQVGLSGEQSQIYSDSGSGKVKWNSLGDLESQPLTWYKIEFDAPHGSDPLALNLGSMGKGQAWVNGNSIGRYWVSFLTSKGQPSQTWYHVPRSFLRSSGNVLVLLEEEEKVNPLRISLDRVLTIKACAKVSEAHLSPVSSWELHKQIDRQNPRRRAKPYVRLGCPTGKIISKILFASFGTPNGDCQRYSQGSCHAASSEKIVKQACLGKTKCSIPASRGKFGDPCPGRLKTLVVDAQCN